MAGNVSHPDSPFCNERVGKSRFQERYKEQIGDILVQDVTRDDCI